LFIIHYIKQLHELEDAKAHDEGKMTEVKEIIYKEQLKAANSQIKEFESMDIDKIKENAAAWQEKFKASEKEWQTKVAGLKYEAAAKDAMADVKFSSNSAKRAFLADLKTLIYAFYIQKPELHIECMGMK